MSEFDIRDDQFLELDTCGEGYARTLGREMAPGRYITYTLLHSLPSRGEFSSATCFEPLKNYSIHTFTMTFAHLLAIFPTVWRRHCLNFLWETARLIKEFITCLLCCTTSLHNNHLYIFIGNTTTPYTTRKSHTLPQPNKTVTKLPWSMYLLCNPTAIHSLPFPRSPQHASPSRFPRVSHTFQRCGPSI